MNKTYLQEKLKSGENIKTINNQTLLGSGNIDMKPVEQTSRIYIKSGADLSTEYTLQFTDEYPMLSLYISGWVGTIRNPSIYWIDWEYTTTEGTWSPKVVASEATNWYFSRSGETNTFYIGRRNDDGSSRQLNAVYDRDTRTITFTVSNNDVAWIVSKY